MTLSAPAVTWHDNGDGTVTATWPPSSDSNIDEASYVLDSGAPVVTKSFWVGPLPGDVPHSLTVQYVADDSALGSATWTPVAQTRDPEVWPFSVPAWPNRSQCTGALTVPAGLVARTATLAVKAQEIPMGMDPTQPLTEVYQNSGQQGNRCVGQAPLNIKIPFNPQLVVPSSSDNYPPCFIGADGVSRYEGGQFCHCGAGQDVTAGHFGLKGTIVDDALGGGSGGSDISTLAGTIRYLEFTKGTAGDKVTVAGSLVPAIRHVIRIDVSVKDLSALNGTGFTWPATKADTGATQPGNANYYSSRVKEAVEGALFVLPQTLDLSTLGLTTIPGKMLAWTFQQFGARPCNTNHNLVWALATEWSTVGRVVDEFQGLFGFSMNAAATDLFGKDMNSIITRFVVVTNDGPNSIGGPGTPLQPPAPALASLNGAAAPVIPYVWHPANGGVYGIPPEITPPTGATTINQSSTFTLGPWPLGL